MSVVRQPRFWTALIVATLALPTMAEGVWIARFGLAEAYAGPEDAEARLGPFVAEPPTRAFALRDWARVAAPSDPAKRKEIAGTLVSAAPLDGGAWLDLAIARRSAGDSMEDVVAALALSSQTWPNEQLAMAGRAAFALPFWSSLPPEAKRTLVSDLVGGWPSLDGNERARLATILEGAPEGSRVEVRAALALSGAPGTVVSAELFPRAPGDASAQAAPAAAEKGAGEPGGKAPAAEGPGSK